MTTSTSRLYGADFIRAAACLIVLFHHLTQKIDFMSPLGNPDIAKVLANGGTFGVGIFFVLSGFLLSRPFWIALDKAEPLPSIRTYVMRRAARILPAFWLALTVTFVLSFTVFFARLDMWLWLRYLAGFFLVSDWHWTSFFPVEVNGPLWSIGFEITSYVLLPFGFLMLFALGRRLPAWATRFAWLAVIGAAVAAHMAFVEMVKVDPYQRGWEHGFQGGAKWWMPWFNPFGFFAMFAVGALAGGLQALLMRWRHWVFDIVCLAALVASAWFMWSQAIHEAGELYGWLKVPYRFPTMHLLVGLALATGPSTILLGRLLDNPPVRYLAQVSFGVYIYHTLVIELMQRYWVPDFVYGGMTDTNLWIIASTLAVVVSIAVATLSYRWLEAPVMAWARSLERVRDRALPLPSSAVQSTG